MLSIKEQKLYQNTTNYAMIGLAFGFAFPIGAILFEMNIHGLELSLHTVSNLHKSNPVLWVIDTAPFILCAISAVAGYLKDQTVHINQGLEKTVEERTLNLKTKNKLLNEEIDLRKKTELELIKAKDAAANAKTQFLSMMSAEIRTPLNAVIGMSELLEDTELNSEQKDFVQNINKSGENLLAKINNILDYAKIESGMFELEELEFSIAHLIDRQDLNNLHHQPHSLVLTK